jgi:glycerate kinase
VLIADALTRGVERVLLACGGSATTDAGLPALAEFDPRAAEIVCLCDVRTAFLAAAEEFGPQKGAGPEQVAELRARLQRIAGELPADPLRLPYTGAAGGLAGGFWANGARLVAGAPFVLDALGFDDRVREADVVLTGEGRLDPGSLNGKAVGEVAKRARRRGVACHAIVGSNALGRDAGARAFESVREAATLEGITAAAGQITAWH